jgi:uncharacterized protein
MTTNSNEKLEGSTYAQWLNQDELRMQKCSECGYVRYPAEWLCPECLSTEFVWATLSGRGAVETFVWYMRDLNPHPAGLPQTPYNVAVVALEEGPRVISNVVDVSFGELAVGDLVSAIFDHGNPDQSLLRFALANRSELVEA